MISVVKVVKYFINAIRYMLSVLFLFLQTLRSGLLPFKNVNRSNRFHKTHSNMSLTFIHTTTDFKI